MNGTDGDDSFVVNMGGKTHGIMCGNRANTIPLPPIWGELSPSSELKKDRGVNRINILISYINGR